LKDEVIVTIIATGFSTPETHIEKAYSIQRSAAILATDPVVTVKKEFRDGVETKGSHDTHAENIQVDDLDVPTFLRRQPSNQPNE